MAVSLEQYRLVMFDLDGTLVDSVYDIHTALNIALVECGFVPVDEDKTRLWVGNGAKVLVNRALHDALDPLCDHHDLSRVLSAFYVAYRSENGRHSRCYEGANALLLRLKEQGISVAIVTNKPYEHAKVLVEKMQLVHDLLIGGDSLDYRKPHPEPLLHCLSYFKVEPSEALMIGDSVNDFQAAQEAGITAIGVSYGYNHGLPIDSANLAGLVDSLGELS